MKVDVFETKNPRHSKTALSRNLRESAPTVQTQKLESRVRFSSAVGHLPTIFDSGHLFSFGYHSQSSFASDQLLVHLAASRFCPFLPTRRHIYLFVSRMATLFCIYICVCVYLKVVFLRRPLPVIFVFVYLCWLAEISASVVNRGPLFCWVWRRIRGNHPSMCFEYGIKRSELIWKIIIKKKTIRFAQVMYWMPQYVVLPQRCDVSIVVGIGFIWRPTLG